MKISLVICVFSITFLYMGWGKKFLVKTKDAINEKKHTKEKGADYESYNDYYDYQVKDDR